MPWTDQINEITPPVRTYIFLNYHLINSWIEGPLQLPWELLEPSFGPTTLHTNRIQILSHGPREEIAVYICIMFP